MSDTFEVEVKYGKQKFKIACKQTDTFADLKKDLSSSSGLLPEHMKILFKGKTWRSDQCLVDANLKNKSKVMLRLTKEGVGAQQIQAVVNKKEIMLQNISKEIDTIENESNSVSDTEKATSEKTLIQNIELLTQILLKLDSVEASGKLRELRKALVVRVLSLIERLKK